jgi:hypothetical protein
MLPSPGESGSKSGDDPDETPKRKQAQVRVGAYSRGAEGGGRNATYLSAFF